MEWWPGSSPHRHDDGVDVALSEALEPVLRDLEHAGAVMPEVRDGHWSDFEGQRTAMLYGPDGSGSGVFVLAGEPLADRVARVADQVQEWAVEALWTAGRPATWPECPDHPDTHPLQAVVLDGRAVWTCPRTGQVVRDIGRGGS
jgi:hypothetical protein